MSGIEPDTVMNCVTVVFAANRPEMVDLAGIEPVELHRLKWSPIPESNRAPRTYQVRVPPTELIGQIFYI